MMEYDPMEQYYIWMASVDGMTPKRFYQLLEHFKDARVVWNNCDEAANMLPEKNRNALLSAHSQRYFYTLFNAIEHSDYQILTRLSDAYPSVLTTIYDPPPLLYVRGSTKLYQNKQIAIVGSRHATRDGRHTAKEIAHGLAEHGVCVISGLARGIDTCAHVGTLEGNGRTIAVLGSGVDVAYPPENAELIARILSNGGSVISEFPPHTPPYAFNFPARNRIISGLSKAVLMVEGSIQSGAMITVDLARDQGKDVFTIPGSIYSSLSEGPNQLLFEGVPIARHHWDILEWYHWAYRPAENKKWKTRQNVYAGQNMNKKQRLEMLDLDEDGKKVAKALVDKDMSFDELLILTELETGKLNSLLTILELRGIIKQLPGRIYRA